jgi:hypothetical protein
MATSFEYTPALTEMLETIRQRHVGTGAQVLSGYGGSGESVLANLCSDQPHA